MRRITSLLLVLTLLFSFCGTALATSAEVSETGAIGIQPFAEQTEWRYREVNGQVQMRLWSITYGVWLTDWIII